MGNWLYEKVLPLLEYLPYALLFGVCVSLIAALIYALLRARRKKPVQRSVREALWGYFFIFPWMVGICIFFLSGVADSLLYSFKRALGIVFGAALILYALYLLFTTFATKKQSASEKK